MSVVNVSAEELGSFCREALWTVGFSAQDASIITDALVTTDTWGTFTHGAKLLGSYIRRVQAGGTRADQSPCVARQGPGWAIVDGRNTMGQVVGTFAMETAISKARECGVAYVGAYNSNHFGAAGYYAWLAAKEGLIGISMANDIPSVAAPGSRKAVTGSNPLAYAVPTGDGDPILLDMAISTVAGGKIYAARQRGEPIADNWIVGPDGLPTTDGELFPHATSLAPMSGPKGYGIALLIESLSAVLTGASVTWQVGSWLWGEQDKATGHGAAFMAIDVGSIMPVDEFYKRSSALIKEIHDAPTADGVVSILLPGEREWNSRRKALENGIQLPDDVVAKLSELAKELKLTRPWLPVD